MVVDGVTLIWVRLMCLKVHMHSKYHIGGGYELKFCSACPS